MDFQRFRVTPGDRILDMGCGAGRHAFELYRRGAHVVAFDLDADELAGVFGPGVRFVHGAEGIARRIANLTADQPFARSQPDLALFTRDGADVDGLAPALATYGLERIEIL